MFFQNSKFKIQNFHQSKSVGFTLVEMIVALGFFTVIMLVVISVLASVSGANEKARTMRIVIDNLNFAVENMARTLRVGSQYHCGSSGSLTIAQACSDPDAGSEFVAFKNIQSGGGTSAFRKGIDGNGIGFIERANNCESTSCPSANWNRITAPEIDITFKRPEPEAHIRVDGSGGDVSSARITVSPPSGSLIGNRFIYVYSSGQIAVTSTE